MRKLKFPTAQTILIFIAIIVTFLTWLVPAGKYDTLAYNTTSETFFKTSLEKSIELPATQETLDNLDIKIPIKKFINGDIYKPIAIPNTYKELASRPKALQN